MNTKSPIDQSKKPKINTDSLSNYPADQLSWVERFAIRIGTKLNRPGWMRHINVWWARIFTCWVLYKVTGHRWRQHHAEILDSIDDNAPILIVSNHRTFFDMYVGITVLRYSTKYRLGTPAVFPVRAPFFYNSLFGIVVNLLFSGGSMWPPVFRDERRGVLNPVSVEVMHSQLALDGVSFGFHPEGRRSKSDDPYTLESPKRGVGDLIERARDEVKILPLFISGLSDNVKREVSLRKREFADSHPIQFYWGQPKSPRDYQGDSMEIARAVHADIQALGEEARRLEQGEG